MEVTNYVSICLNNTSRICGGCCLLRQEVWSIVIGVTIAIAQKNEDKDRGEKNAYKLCHRQVVIAVIVGCVSVPYSRHCGFGNVREYIGGATLGNGRSLMPKFLEIFKNP